MDRCKPERQLSGTLDPQIVAIVVVVTRLAFGTFVLVLLLLLRRLSASYCHRKVEAFSTIILAKVNEKKRKTRRKSEDGVEAYQTITEVREGQLTKNAKREEITRREKKVSRETELKVNQTRKVTTATHRKRKLKAEKTTERGEREKRKNAPMRKTC